MTTSGSSPSTTRGGTTRRATSSSASTPSTSTARPSSRSGSVKAPRPSSSSGEARTTPDSTSPPPRSSASRARFALRDLPFEDLRQGSALEIPWPDDAFDLVFSHGVLHHIPDIEHRPAGDPPRAAARRRARGHALRPAVAELPGVHQAPTSRRTGDGLPAGPCRPLPAARHRRPARRQRPSRSGWVATCGSATSCTAAPTDRSTPSPGCTTSTSVAADFPDFEITKSYQRYMHAPPLPVTGGPLASRLGWHLWVHLRPRCVFVAGSCARRAPALRSTSVCRLPAAHCAALCQSPGSCRLHVQAHCAALSPPRLDRLGASRWCCRDPGCRARRARRSKPTVVSVSRARNCQGPT